MTCVSENTNVCLAIAGLHGKHLSMYDLKLPISPGDYFMRPILVFKETYTHCYSDSIKYIHRLL